MAERPSEIDEAIVKTLQKSRFLDWHALCKCDMRSASRAVRDPGICLSVEHDLMVKDSECHREPFDPTPEKIEERAAEIRRRWSANVIKRRRVSVEPQWMPPLVMTIELIRELNARSRE